MVTLEKILQYDNLNQALKQVVSSKGTAGVDEVTVGELEP